MTTRKAIGTVFFLNLIFFCIQIVGGLFTNSVALISGAIHDLGDTLTLGLGWRLETIAERGRDQRFSFGYKRFSLLSAFINGTVLIAGSGAILYAAIGRLIRPEPVEAFPMLGFAALGIVVNVIGALRMHHGKTIHEHMVSLHFWEDVLNWVSIVIVSVAINFFHAPWLDPALAIAMSLFIGFNAGWRLKKTIKLFLQSIPDDVDLPMVEKNIAGLAGVLEVHDSHIWSLDGTSHVFTTHVVTTKDLTAERILQLRSDIRKHLKQYGIIHVTVEIEHEGDACAVLLHPDDERTLLHDTHRH
jgi:cobalt-zinc-cadmium efflux system protein